MQLFRELQRRNVFRVSIGYIVSCWLLIQVADIVLESFEAPDWVMKTIMLVLALGFPVVVFFSWAFEVTPDGIKRESEIDRSESITHITGRKLDRAIFIVLLIAVGYFAYDKFILGPQRDAALIENIQQTMVEQAPAPDAPAEPPPDGFDPASIAVLPFADLSPERDQGYFSDGIAEEILNVLVKVDGLQVASRTSAFSFKDQGSLGIPTIAESLKVRNVLEGSVRKAGDTVRITAQLIDGRTDKHLWSQTYDRVLSAENLFAIQDEIARAIVTELAKSFQLEVAPESRMVPVATENLDAYQLYLRARDLFRRRSADNIPQVVEMFEQAVELDPDYAEAWAGLAAVAVVAPSWGVEGRDFVQLTQDAARRAIELDDSLALPYAVLGSAESNIIPTDYTKTFEYYEQALERDPNSVNARLWRGIDLNNVGMFEAAKADLEQCLVIDPMYENCRRFLALAELFSGNTDRALELFEQGIAGGSFSQIGMFTLAYAAEGDLRSVLFTLALLEAAFNDAYRSTDQLFRALTDPDFDFDREWQKLVNKVKAEHGPGIDVFSEIRSLIALAFRRYEGVSSGPFSTYWWHPNVPEFLASPHRKRMIREMGIDDYWRQAGFPPQCRPVGEDDFECD